MAKYLGLPLVIGRPKREVFGFVLEAAKKRMINWKNQFLSQADKEVFLKFVIDALPVYIMSCFQLPGNIIKELGQRAAKFWWGCKG